MLTTKISQLQIGDVKVSFTDEGIVLKKGSGGVIITEEILDIIKATIRQNGNGIIKDEK